MDKLVTKQGWALKLGRVLHQLGQGNLQGQGKRVQQSGSQAVALRQHSPLPVRISLVQG